MARTRSKSAPRLTRDAERLIALANGLHTSGSLTEDRFWEGQIASLLEKLLEHGNDVPMDGALDQLWQTNSGPYDVLIERVEGVSESVTVMQGDLAWETLLIAAPVVAWSKYAIPSGPIAREDAQALKVQLQAHVLAADTRVTLVPYLYSVDQLPRHFSELRRLAARLGDAAVTGEIPRIDFARMPETAQLLSDARFVLASVATLRGKPLFHWQEDASGHTGRTTSLEQWIAQARPTIAKLLPGCVFECLLPDAYYVNCREADRRVRPYAIRAGVSYLENAMQVETSQLRAVIAGFGEERVDEYRVGFTVDGDSHVAHGVVWPLYGREDENSRPGPIEDLLAELAQCGVTEVKKLTGTFEPEYCDDCGAPLFASPDAEMVHAELPEDADSPAAHFH
ncbi:MAG: DUF2863 family protein [Betaproteobacteria bacterium]|nr:DUF2863 family protein [Betaproteobacteria bacterium]